MEDVKTGWGNEQKGPKYPSKFGVYPRYEIINYQGKRIICVPWKDINDPEIEVKYYSPMDVGCIYSHFAAVNSEEKLLAFAHQYGLLGLSYEDESVAPSGYSSISQTILFDYIDKCSKDIDNLKFHINYIRNIDYGGNPPVKRKPQEKIFMNLENYPEWKDVLQNASPSKQDIGDIALSVSAELGGIRPAASFTKDGTLIPGFAYLTLHAAIWHQVFITLTRQEKFKECPFCHSWHTARGQFCPTPPFYRRPPCENAYYQKQHRGKPPGGKPGRPKKNISKEAQS